MALVTVCPDAEVWDAAVHSLGGHPLQLWGWGEVKAKHSWAAHRLIVHDGDTVIGGAQVLSRKVPVVSSALLYAPRGPFWATGRGDEVMEALVDYVRARGKAVVLTVEPDGLQLPRQELFRPSPNPVLMSHTLIIDLQRTQEQIMQAMAKNHRYYIRKGGRDDFLEIKRASSKADIDAVMTIYRDTAARAGFGLHEDAYYHDIHHELGSASACYLAVYNGDPCAFVWDVNSASTAFELYGGVTKLGQKQRVNYPLKWAAIVAAHEAGCTRYDMNGLLTDGISDFKEGFAHDHDCDDLIGSWDLALSPLYSTFVKGLPLAKRGIQKLRSLTQ